ncbi:CRIB domain-containing protein RIC10-like isoform X2 [Raphanus sativus]|uniref:CRIB domain-containing protein RIC10-like isoform X2 n=1 Tax=Raphanus sativus TaxID=3726 RepID=A0A6J0M9S1_RAPSA|nr:CRIB domain-containing protein RIC10-like isoform X2 [Raphanus sativus]
MAMKMKGIYKGFKRISQIFAMEKERDEIKIGYPTDVKHMAHIGLEGSSSSGPGWMSEFKIGADQALSPRASSFSSARPSSSFFTSSSTGKFDLGSSRRTICDTPRDIPPVTPLNLPKNNNKKSRRKKSASSSLSPKSSRSSILSKSSYKSTVSRLI